MTTPTRQPSRGLSLKFSPKLSPQGETISIPRPARVLSLKLSRNNIHKDVITKIDDASFIKTPENPMDFLQYNINSPLSPTHQTLVRQISTKVFPMRSASVSAPASASGGRGLPVDARQVAPQSSTRLYSPNNKDE